jgi:2-polyprenyl-3-methyl-5-hydroxy-6-metoxy-1,4-benzoquinol methylase
MANNVSTYWHEQAVSFDSIYLDESKTARRVNETFRRAVYDRFHIALRESGDVTGKSVLDIGCGSGHYEVEYAKRGAARVTGLDFAPGMLELARRLTQREGVADRCTFVQGDFLEKDLGERFDVVLAMGVFDYVNPALPFLRRMVQASQGRVIASFPGKNLVRMHLRRWRYALRNCPVYFYSEQDVDRLAREAGLREWKIVKMAHSGTAYVLAGSV